MIVLIAPDKFKGTLTARAAAEAVARGWSSVRPEDELDLLPVTDGGDGFGSVMGELVSAELEHTDTVDAAHRPIRAEWWWAPSTGLAIIESARAIGLAALPRGKFHPFELDSFGLGALIQAAASHQAKRCVVGIGGSGTNDGGFGMARALGWHFFNTHDEPIERWTELHALSHLQLPQQRVAFEDLVVAVDVQNPLLGLSGCTRIFGPQKGLQESEYEFTERCLQQLAVVVAKQLGLSLADSPGSGAAGGLGFALQCFAGARVEPGFEYFARQADLADRVRNADVVLTGEGAIDASTAMGKGVGQLARICRDANIPCIGLAGRTSAFEQASSLFTRTHAMAPEFTSVENAQSEPKVWLEKLAAHAAELFGKGGPPRNPEMLKS